MQIKLHFRHYYNLLSIFLRIFYVKNLYFCMDQHACSKTRIKMLCNVICALHTLNSIHAKFRFKYSLFDLWRDKSIERLCILRCCCIYFCGIYKSEGYNVGMLKLLENCNMLKQFVHYMTQDVRNKNRIKSILNPCKNNRIVEPYSHWPFLATNSALMVIETIYAF